MWRVNMAAFYWLIFNHVVVDLPPVCAVAHGSAGTALPVRALLGVRGGSFTSSQATHPCNCHAPLRRHPNAFALRGVGVDGFADVHGVGAHLNVHVDEANV
jgi:hypothetical protein